MVTRTYHDMGDTFEMRRFTPLIKHAAAFAKWIGLSVAAGLLCGAVGTGFYYTVDYVTKLRITFPWMLYTLPVLGLVIVWLYRVTKTENDGGTNTIYRTVRTGEKVTLWMAPLLFVSTALIHLGGGSAAREGAALQLGGSFAGACGRLLRLRKNDLRVITMCGMAAVYSAMFGTPLTAALFCVEVINVGKMQYAALLPCAAASYTAYLLATHLGVTPMAFSVPASAFSVTTALQTLALGIFCAGVSILICVTLKKAEKLYKKYIPNPYLRIATGGVLVILLTLLLGTRDYNGIGRDVLARAISGEALPWAFVCKMVMTALTLGAGFRGGETVPTPLIGATFGCFAGALIGLSPALGAAVGTVAVFCGAVNCPMTAIVMGVEMFGAGNLPLYAVACVVSYTISLRFNPCTAQKTVLFELEPVEETDSC